MTVAANKKNEEWKHTVHQSDDEDSLWYIRLRRDTTVVGVFRYCYASQEKAEAVIENLERIRSDAPPPTDNLKGNYLPTVDGKTYTFTRGIQTDRGNWHLRVKFLSEES